MKHKVRYFVWDSHTSKAWRVLAVALALAFSISARAQDSSTREALATEPAAPSLQTLDEVPAETGFHFSSPFNVGAVGEKNLTIGQTRYSDDVLLITLPEMAFRTASGRTDFFVGYKPEFQVFRRYNELDTLDHAGRIRFRHRPTGRWLVDVTDTFVQTEDPTRGVTEGIFFLPRGQFLQNTLSVYADYDLTSQTKISPVFLNTTSKLLLPNLRETELFTGRFEQMGTAAGATVSHMLTRQHQVSGSYSFYVIQDLEAGIHLPFTNGARTHSIAAGYQYGFEPRGVSFMISGGLLYSRSATYRAAARFEKRWTALVFSAGLSREVSILGELASSSPLGNGILPTTFYETAMIGLEGRLLDRVGIEFRAQVGRSNPGIQVDDIQSFLGHVKVSYRLTDRVYPFIGTDIYSQSYSEMLLMSMARRRYYAGFSIILSRPQDWQETPGKKTTWPDDDTTLVPPKKREIE